MKIRKHKFEKWKRTVYDTWYAFGKVTPGAFLGNALNARACFDYSENGNTAEVCLYIQESTGKLTPCCEVEDADRAVRGREILKVNMEMWEESRADCTLPGVEWLAMCRELKLPDWVFYEVETRKVKFYTGRYKEFLTYYAKDALKHYSTLDEYEKYITKGWYDNLPKHLKPDYTNEQT